MLPCIGVGGLQGCIQVSEVFRLKQVVSAGAQTVLEREPCKRPSSCPRRASPMRTASVNHTPAVPYHTLIHGSLSTPSTIPFLGNTQYNTNSPPGVRRNEGEFGFWALVLKIGFEGEVTTAFNSLGDCPHWRYIIAMELLYYGE